MSDKLVERLREAFVDLDDLNDAATRIEELEERLEAATDDAKEAEAYAGELEAKMAKAVEEAEKYQHAFAAQSRKLQAVLHIEGVRAALAELTGGKDE